MVAIRQNNEYEYLDIWTIKVILATRYILYFLLKEAECQDTKNSRWCKRQKNKGKCSDQNVWMKCHKSCEKCGNGK